MSQGAQEKTDLEAAMPLSWPMGGIYYSICLVKANVQQRSFPLTVERAAGTAI